jgi:hypothetical protein
MSDIVGRYIPLPLQQLKTSRTKLKKYYTAKLIEFLQGQKKLGLQNLRK